MKTAQTLTNDSKTEIMNDLMGECFCERRHSQTCDITLTCRLIARLTGWKNKASLLSFAVLLVSYMVDVIQKLS